MRRLTTSQDVQAAQSWSGRSISFDNVGGDIPDAALTRLAIRGGSRIFCGGIITKNATEPSTGTGAELLNDCPARTDGGLPRARFASRAAEAVGARSPAGQAGKVEDQG